MRYYYEGQTDVLLSVAAIARSGNAHVHPTAKSWKFHRTVCQTTEMAKKNITSILSHAGKVGKRSKCFLKSISLFIYPYRVYLSVVTERIGRSFMLN